MGKTYNITRRFRNLLTFSVRRRPGKSSNILISFFLLPLSFFLPSLIPFWANRDCEAHTMWFNGQLVELVDIGLVHVVCGINTRFIVWKLSLTWGLILTAYKWVSDIPNSLSWTFVFWIDWILQFFRHFVVKGKVNWMSTLQNHRRILIQLVFLGFAWI